jgi:hypothetical protein
MAELGHFRVLRPTIIMSVLRDKANKVLAMYFSDSTEQRDAINQVIEVGGQWPNVRGKLKTVGRKQAITVIAAGNYWAIC